MTNTNNSSPYSDNAKEWVKTYYGETLTHTDDLKTNACCATGAPPPWLKRLLDNVHDEVQSRFYGCGYPIPPALTGATVIDLGCGTGRDVFLLAQLVGENGAVYGVDMTENQLEVPKRLNAWHAEKFAFKTPNTHFVQGYIEDLSFLPLQDNNVDVVVSNCVVNLSPRKDLVMQEVYRLLKEGGEFYLSDVLVDRRLPTHIANDPLLYAECLGGAMYQADFEQLAKQIGFLDPRIVEIAPITIMSKEIEQKVGDAKFYSITYRLLKLPALEFQQEDYGQTAIYTAAEINQKENLIKESKDPDSDKNTAKQNNTTFILDKNHCFNDGKTTAIDGNTAIMLKKSRFSPYFTVQGNNTEHLGPWTVRSKVSISNTAKKKSGGCC